LPYFFLGFGLLFGFGFFFGIGIVIPFIRAHLLSYFFSKSVWELKLAAATA